MKNTNISACKRLIRSKPIPCSLQQGFVENGWAHLLPGVYQRTAELFAENAAASKQLIMHYGQILPTIALYEAAIQAAGSREAALAFLESWAYRKMEKMLPIARGLMKLGLYRLMPSLCSLMLDKLFGRAAGFDYRLVPDAPKFAVDMTRCPYLDTYTRYGYPELTQFACRADDLTYGQLHPKLVWGRTQTLGMGGSCCEFRLHLKQNAKGEG
ncbi:MAG: L-2-amino-thiazoline-4-carboxylic acid hydrolase [Clostridiales bacterium]|nr:L-2-amino-thiazoline-4-carboxylic acid hydrolase [Clostridiales bacterium]